MPRFIKGEPEARQRALHAINSRWAAATPEKRAQQGQMLKDARAAAYRRKAAASFAAVGYEPTEADLDRAVASLAAAHMAKATAASIVATRQRAADANEMAATRAAVAGALADPAFVLHLRALLNTTGTPTMGEPADAS